MVLIISLVYLLIPSVSFSLSINFKFNNQSYCPDLKPQNDFDEDTLLGVWFVHEYIFHKETKVETSSGNPYCPVVQFRTFDDYMNGAMITGYIPQPPTPYPPPMNTPYLNRNYGQNNLQEPHRIRHFILEWHEGIWKDEYHIKVNTSHKGFWPTDLPSSAVDNMYTYFGGVIQVLTMSNNYLVLNFCMRLPHSQLYSVVLSRSENQLTPETLANIHNIFTMKQLSTSTLQRVCDSGATAIKFSGLLLLFVIIKWSL